MPGQRKLQTELTIEDLDRELIARGAQISQKDLFKFEDTEGTPARDDIMARVKGMYDSGSSFSPNPALALINTDALVKTLKHKTRQIEENRKRGIWYEDHRMDYFGITDERVKRNAKCVVAIILEKDLIDEKSGFLTLKVKNYGKVFNLYEGEAFREQPIAAGLLWTGFLVKKDVIATAAHCVLGYDLSDFCFVFGFKMLDLYTPVTQMANENIYKGKKIIGCAFNPKGNKVD